MTSFLQGGVKEKERRLHRVGLSYKCKRCGQPKKGHVCPLNAPGPASEALDDDACTTATNPTASTATKVKGKVGGFESNN